MSDSQQKIRPDLLPFVVPPPPRSVVVGPFVYLVTSVVILVLYVVSLFTPWYVANQYKSSLYQGADLHSTVTLWKTKTKLSISAEVSTDVSDYCWPVLRRVRVMEAFACAVTAVAVACVVVGALYLRRGAESFKLRQWCCGLGILCFCFGAILLSFNFSVYYWSFKDCGTQSSYHSKLYEPGIGFGFSVTAWVLSFFAPLMVAYNTTIAVDARSIDTAVLLFTIFSLVGVVFMTTATPVQHWYYKDGSTKKAIDVTYWDTKTGNFDWNLLATQVKTSVPRREYTCSKVKELFAVAGGVSIAASSLNFLSLFWAVLVWQYLVIAVIPGVVFAVLGFLLSLATFVLQNIIFKNNWCDGAYAYEKQKYVLSAGYALTAVAFCSMLLAIIFGVIAHVGIKKFFPTNRKVLAS